MLERRNLGEKHKEYTTQKIRQEWAEHEELFQDKKPLEKVEKQTEAEKELEQKQEIVAAAAAEETVKTEVLLAPPAVVPSIPVTIDSNKDETKSKTKKRRKKSQMKKKNSQRKTSSSSSAGSAAGGDPANADAISWNSVEVALIDENEVPACASSIFITNTNSSSNDEQPSAPLLTAHTGDESTLSEFSQHVATPTNAARHDLDIHFFSDTEITTPTSLSAAGGGRGAGRPSTPIQSDSELETTMRDKRHVGDDENSAHWKWGELPTPEQAKGVSEAEAQQSERQSMLSNMFSFMKRANRLRKEGATNQAGDIYLSDLDAGSMDPEMAALYFPSPKTQEGKEQKATQSGDEDRESGNGTSLPHSPSSLEENHKSLDSDFDDCKQQTQDKKCVGCTRRLLIHIYSFCIHSNLCRYLDFVSMSMCGMHENGGPPTDEEFSRHLVTYPDVS